MGLIQSPSKARAVARAFFGLGPFVFTIVVAGLTAIVVVLSQSPLVGPLLESPATYLLFTAALLVGELVPIPISRGGGVTDYITTGTTFTVALTITGPLSWAVGAQVLAVLVDDLRKGRPARKVLFNAGQYTLSAVAARLVWCALTGQPVLGGRMPFQPDDLWAALIAGAVFVVVNHFLVGVAVALEARQPLFKVIGEDLQFSVTTSGVLVALAPLAAFLVDASPYLLLLLLVPVVAVHASAAQAMRHEREALHDGLTGLANRELLQSRLSRLLKQAQAEDDRGPGLLLADLDHFKDINDGLGHHVGDELLVELGRRLQAFGVDLAARLGGDEFAVICEGGREEMGELADHVLAALQAPVDVQGLRLQVGASVGLVVAPDDGEDVAVLLKNADIAMYEAKRDRGRVCWYRPDLDVNSVERLSLLTDLREALDHSQLSVVFQPQLEIDSGRVVGAEALVRWHHPQRGMVMPDQFIELAENSGLIGHVTTYVLEQSLLTLSRLDRRGYPLQMSVNLSARHLSDLSLPGRVADALAGHGVEPGRLTLEVTETGILSDPVRVDEVMRQLRAMGVGIAVDDYGTGHASLSYLKRLAVDELKIDRSFVTEMNANPSDLKIVRSTIALGHELGLRIVAEGVEDQATLEQLARIGCDVAQGWLIGRPVPERQLLERLTRDAERSRRAASGLVGPTTEET
ncbi:MAG TPA: EAL domain-containing protein [Actinomycetales bacterium]|nr:EAL domain-containing protein [Actinomycetales bacterium]